MVVSFYVASLSLNQDNLFYSRAYCNKVPLKNTSRIGDAEINLDQLCSYDKHGLESRPLMTQTDHELALLIRPFDGNNVLSYILENCAQQWKEAVEANSALEKSKRKDWFNGTFQYKESHLLVHWGASTKGTALIMLCYPEEDRSLVRTTLRVIYKSLGRPERIRLESPKDILNKPHIIALVLKYYLPCGQLIVQPPNTVRQVEDALRILLK